MRLLTNPLFARAALVLVSAVAAFVLGVIAIRMLRRSLLAEDDLSEVSGGPASLPLQAYTVIQQLKQQKFALQNEQQAQRQRAKTTEHITASIIANLPIGMLFVAPNGLVRQANTAARKILGFASPMGMSISDVFREARIFAAGGEEIKVRQAFNHALEEQLHNEDFECCYAGPAGDHRELKITLIPVRTPEGAILGLAAAIADQAEAAALREAQLLRAEESAELALELRNSLATIRDWAEQFLVAGGDRATSLAQDISTESRRLERVVAQFVTGAGKAKSAHV